MMRPDPAVIRASLRTFLGEEKYLKFLEAGVNEPLRYWQEVAWSNFVEAFPTLAVTPTERADALNICQVHGCTLQIGRTASPEGYTFAIPDIERQLFPNASLMPILEFSGIIQTFYCPTCNAARLKYRKDKYSL